MDTLDALLDRLVPPDEAPGALACDLAPAVRARLHGLDELLARLDGCGDLDAALRRLDESGDATFRELVALVHALYYADPRSWPALGYTSNVPGRP